MSKVYFFDYAKSKSISEGLSDLFTQSLIEKIIQPGESVAIKLHMGEMGNNTYIRPMFAKIVVDLVRKMGGKPFVTDTTVLYPGPRHTPEGYLETAAANGFAENTIGAPVLIADTGDKGVNAAIKDPIVGCEIKKVELASRIYDADSLLILSHTKAHPLTGFAGAFKNLGMGCTTKNGKAVQHKATIPIHDESKCVSCGKCVDTCPFGALALVDGKPVLDSCICTGCCACLMICSSEAYSWAPGYGEKFMVNVAHAAYPLLKKFKGKIGFINFVQDIATICDCAGWALKPIIQDIGILASLDPIAIDKASMDLIDKAPVVVSPSPASPPDILGKIWGLDSLVLFKTAERLGLGSMEYKLVVL